MPNTHSHPDEGALERYALGQLTTAQSQEIEEHILVCSICQEKLESEDEFLDTIRTALRELRPAQDQVVAAERPFRLFRNPAIVGVLTLVTVAFLVISLNRRTQTPYPVRLESHRGPGVASDATAPAGSPLRLTADLTGVAPTSSLLMEISDSQGRSVWQSPIDASGSSAAADLQDTLPAGQYWVRVYNSRDGARSRGALLREFSLRLR